MCRHCAKDARTFYPWRAISSLRSCPVSQRRISTCRCGISAQPSLPRQRAGLAPTDCTHQQPACGSGADPPDQCAQLRVDLRSPSLWARLPTPVAAKAGPVPTHECLGPDDCENLQDRRKPAIQLDKEPAIMVREPDATRQPTPHDIQLMSKHRVLSFKPQLRLEWRGQDGQNETEQPNHPASLGDSIATSTRIHKRSAH
jgi:hypothetical protein